ncbi:MAG: hypothetical protein HY885_15080 [Deltaproteobacteria bacterium]|nr:hypothetical protein [Deltaproteobacteria bacterium]
MGDHVFIEADTEITLSGLTRAAHLQTDFSINPGQLHLFRGRINGLNQQLEQKHRLCHPSLAQVLSGNGEQGRTDIQTGLMQQGEDGPAILFSDEGEQVCLKR